MNEAKVDQGLTDSPLTIHTDLRGNPLRGYIAITRDGQALGLVWAASQYDAIVRFLDRASDPTVSLWLNEDSGWRMADGGEVPPDVHTWDMPQGVLGRVWDRMRRKGTESTR